MKTRKEMSQKHAAEVPRTFWDVAARFSEEEWTLLHHWQKELYNNVMNEINQALRSLGPLIAISVFSLRPKEKDDLCLKECQVLEQENAVNISPSDVNTDTDVLLMKQKNLVDTCNKDREIVDGPSTAIHVVDSGNILKMEEELESGLMHVEAVEVEESNIRQSLGQSHRAPVVSFAIKKEVEVFPVNRMDSERRGSITSKTGLAVVSPGPEVTTPGPDVAVPVVSIIIKEEQETDLISIQDYHRRESFYSPAGNGGTKRRACGLLKCNDKSPLTYSMAKKFKANMVHNIHERTTEMSVKRNNVRCVINEDTDNAENNDYVLVVKETKIPTNKVVMDPDIDVTIEGVVIKLLVDTVALITIVSQEKFKEF
ncbi:hypothetical protein NDU88_006125 [Pleurodeles waltl]|uniref:KRAB domain-containing protein n=1 Tax=Pleurodeles waltl TaxID=8319 RepID=A0AAV7QMQ1_PLEWA|nr:hypothetical protein NDU88_006125 [Pleurodeles waltl]